MVQVGDKVLFATEGAMFQPNVNLQGRGAKGDEKGDERNDELKGFLDKRLYVVLVVAGLTLLQTSPRILSPCGPSEGIPK